MLITQPRTAKSIPAGHHEPRRLSAGIVASVARVLNIVEKTKKQSKSWKVSKECGCMHFERNHSRNERCGDYENACLRA
jgi:hypothetical protein